MTQQERQRLTKEAYYMTQYASYMTDEGFYHEWFDSLPADVDVDKVIEWLAMTTEAPDRLNQMAFGYMFNLDSDTLDGLIALYEAYESGADDLMRLLDIDVYELFPDDLVGTSDFFEEVADSDLRDNGLSARSLYWAKDIPASDGLLKLDIFDEFEEIGDDDILDATEEHGAIRNYLENLK
ncbi:MAG: hypothetical protein PHW40_07550 [Candidatus Izemoplasmatales bacterium]|nr:hypothetical protein [Candidatus Izemoplasmatales bacterium]